MRLHEAASSVRHAIETTDLSGRGGNLADFPQRCCHHATKLLAAHLWQSGWTGLKVATGRRNGDAHSEHVWLQAGDVIVDITADQFDEGLGPVVVARCSEWHAAWNPALEPLHEDRLAGWQAAEGDVFDAYRKIMSTLASEVRR